MNNCFSIYQTSELADPKLSFSKLKDRPVVVKTRPVIGQLNNKLKAKTVAATVMETSEGVNDKKS